MNCIAAARLCLLIFVGTTLTNAEARSPTLCAAMEAAWRRAPGETTTSTWPTHLSGLGLSFPVWRTSNDPDRIIALRTEENARLAKLNKIYDEKWPETLARHRSLIGQNKEDLAYSTIDIGQFKSIAITRLGIKILDISKNGKISREDWYYDLRFDIAGNDKPQFIDGVLLLQAGRHWYLYHNGGALYDLVIWKEADNRVRIDTSDSAFCSFKFAGELR